MINESRRKGEEALTYTDLEKNPLPKATDEDEAPTNNIILQRAEDFLGTLIKVTRGGKLTIGDAYTALFLDGNGKNVVTDLNTGVILDISGEGAHGHLENGVLMNSTNRGGYSAAVKIHRDASFEMSGGRISDNHMSTRYSATYPTSAGGVHVMPGAQFRMTGGSIDNNSGVTGGVLVGDLYGGSTSYDKSKFAVFDMEGGIIARNRGDKGLGMGGGVNTFSKGIFNFENGIIAENRSPTGGGIFVSDQYVTGFDGISYSKTYDRDYESHLINHKATLNMNGGLLYKNNAYRTYNPNRSGAGGGIFVSSNHVNLNGGQMLDNYAANMGGGVYVSIVPYTQALKDILITENHAFTSNEIYHYLGGNGGGIWNCPIGIVHFEDGHSVYVFDNVRYDKNSDLYFHARNGSYRLYRGNNSEVIGKTFYSTLSPITKEGNFIPYIQSGTDGDIPEHMWHTARMVSVVAPYDARLKAEAWRNARFFVLGNEAQKGGGIGSNANLIAEGEHGDYEIEVRKKWDSGVTNRPERVQVDLFIGDLKYAEVERGKHNGWRAVFNNLPYTRAELAAKGLSYTVKEHHDDYYVVIEEAYTQPEKNVAVGALDVLRYISQLANDTGERYDYSAWYEWYKPMIFVHVLDTDGNVVLTERTFWTTLRIRTARRFSAIPFGTGPL